MIGNLQALGSPSLLGVFAHPDDETFLAGGTLAKYAATGWNVVVLCATRGEAGQRGDYRQLTVEEFGELRQREFEAACHALGVRSPLFLDCADQRLARDCWRSATEEIVRLIQRLRPQVVLTFGPDGISGHPDHVALSEIVTNAFRESHVLVEASEVASRGLPLQAKRLYYVLRSASVPSNCTQAATIAALPLTTEIDIAGFGEHKLRAVYCYRSQHHLEPKEATTERAILESPERFHRAFPPYNSVVIEQGFGEPDTCAWF